VAVAAEAVLEALAGVAVLEAAALAVTAEGCVDEKVDSAEMAEYVEIGGLTWRQGAWTLFASWPFATIRISRERVRLTIKFWKIWDLAFDLEKAELQAIRRRRGLFSVGAQFEHRKADYPPFLLFWTFRQKTLFGELRRLGYNVLDSPR
jgi:hypothetical protein